MYCSLNCCVLYGLCFACLCIFDTYGYSLILSNFSHVLLVGHLSVFFGKLVLHYFLPLFMKLFVVEFMSAFYIFDISPFSDVFCTDMFSPSVGYLVLVTVSLCGRFLICYNPICSFLPFFSLPVEGKPLRYHETNIECFV